MKFTTTLSTTTLLLGLLISPFAHAAPESWYWGFDLGFGGMSVGGSKAQSLASQDANSGFTGITVSSHLFVYWPVSSNAILGIVSGGAVRTYIPKSSSGSFYSTSNAPSFGVSMLTASYLYTFEGDEPCLGPFVKGDLGYGVAYQTNSGSPFALTGSDSGLGIRAGVGYGIAASDTARIIATFEYGGIAGVSATHYYSFTGGLLF